LKDGQHMMAMDSKVWTRNPLVIIASINAHTAVLEVSVDKCDLYYQASCSEVVPYRLILIQKV